MLSSDRTTTTRDLWDLALGPDVQLRGGATGLDRAVAWVTALRPSYPLFPDLDQGHLAVGSPEVARRLDSHLTLSYLIRELAHAQAAGLIVDEAPDPKAAALANEMGLPLFEVPDGTDLRALERDLLRGLLDREGYEARRAAEWRQQFQALLSQGGMMRVVEGLAADLGTDVQLCDACDMVVAQVGGDHALDAASSDGRHHFPVLVAGKLLGTLRVSVPQRPFAWLPVAARQAAEVCGLEMIQDCVRRETEDQLGTELVTAILDPTADQAAVEARLVRQNYRLSPGRRHVVIALAAPASQQAPSAALVGALESDLRFLARQAEASTLVLSHQGAPLLLLSVTVSANEQRLRDWLTQAAEPVILRGYCLGVSRTVNDAPGLRHAVQQALATSAMGLRMGDRSGPLFYSELGLYRLLLGLRDQAEVQRFYAEALEPLVTYDRDHGTELVTTLRAFFEQNANASETARKLFVHRNTLNYRLQRIAEIGELDLDNADTRLALQVALRIHYLEG